MKALFVYVAIIACYSPNQPQTPENRVLPQKLPQT